jgi:hypothetical protein
MRVIRINTTAWTEEDFYLVTTLDDDQIIAVINPIVQSERDSEDYIENPYDNDTLFEALKEKYPDAYVDMYTEFDKLTI